MLNAVSRVSDTRSYFSAGQTMPKEQRKNVLESFRMGNNHALNTHCCVKFVIPFILTGIPRVKSGFFYKSNSVSFM